MVCIVDMQLHLYNYVLIDAVYNGFLFIAVNEHLTQPEAMKNCASHGATLASVSSDDENSFVQTLTSEEYCEPE